ncbi:MAG: hypothetical protein CENE_00812 [Candidatus Celerinatantimonas neptuna]|nr:MAG: hypothetical protein CENE_00812 [Candidatus Celerinatantimonas neptuna]
MLILLRRFVHRCWLAFAVIIITAAIALSALRWGFAYANEYRNQIVQWLIGDSTSSLQIGYLSARLDHYRPVLVLRHVLFRPDKSNPYQLYSRSVLINFDLLNSLKQRRITFREIRLRGFDLTVPSMNGLSENENDQKVSRVFANIFLKRMDNFQISDGAVHFYSPHQPMHSIYIKSMRWQNTQKLHQGEGEASLFKLRHRTSLVHFVVKLNSRNQKADLLDLPGVFYASGQHIQLSKVGELFQSTALKKLNTNLNFKLWGQFGGRKPSLWQLQWQPSTIRWQNKHGKTHRLVIKKGYFYLRGHSDYLQLDSDQLDLSTDGKSWGHLNLQGVIQSDQSQFYLNHLPLPLITPALELFPEISSYPIQLTSGMLNDVRVRYQMDQQKWDYRANLANVGVTTEGNFTGVSQLSGHIWGNAHQLYYQLQVNKGALRFDRLFEKDWPVDLLKTKGHVDWNSNAVSVTVNQFDMKGPLAQIHLRGRFDWRKNASPWLSLYAQMNLPKAQDARRFYPLPIMPKNVSRYLNQSIKGGSVNNAQLLWYGSLDQFPYHHPTGIFQALVPLKDSQFKFQPNWPPLKKMRVDLLFQNESLHMESQSAALGKVHIEHVNAAIEHLNTNGILTIQAKIKNQNPGYINQYLQQSPLPGLVNTMRALPMTKGRVDGRIYLKIPLDGKNVLATGQAKFSNTSLRVKDLGLGLTKLNGVLNFNNAQLRGHGFKAFWRGQPILIDLHGDENPDNYQLGIGLQGNWDVKKLQRRLDNPLWLSSFGGQMNWRGKVNVAFKSKGLQYNAKFDSNLAQLQSKLPAPLFKSTSQSWPSHLYVSGNNYRGQGRIAIGEKLYSRLRYTSRSGIKLTALRVNVGNRQTLPGLSQLLPASGTSIDVDIQKASFAPWLYHFGNVADDPQNSTSLIPPLKMARIHVQQLNFFDQPIDQFQLTNPKGTFLWYVSSHRLEGDFTLPSHPDLRHPLKINLTKVELPKLNLKLVKQLMAKQKDQLLASKKQMKLYPLSVVCQKCTLGRFKLGKVSLWLPFANHSMHDGYFNQQSVGKAELNAKLNWLPSPRGMISKVTGDFKTKDTGKFLQAMGVDKALEQTPIKGQFSFQWKGLPFQLDTHTLNGEVQWKAGEGVLTQVSDQGTRLLTLASLDSIRRRLQLDFRDIFDKGLYFNSARAKSTITDGVMTNKDFFMNAVSGVIHGKGQLNLNTGKIDYRLSFSPKVTSSLPVLAAFAVTPITGVAVLAISKLLEPVIDVITQVDFQITGDIEHPKLVEVKREHKKIKVPSKLRGNK